MKTRGKLDLALVCTSHLAQLSRPQCLGLRSGLLGRLKGQFSLFFPKFAFDHFRQFILLNEKEEKRGMSNGVK